MDAVRQLFEDMGVSLEELGAQPRSVAAFLFGGAAVHYHTQYRVSSDVDAEIIPNGFNPSELKIFLKNAPVVDYEDTDDGGLRMVELDGNFTLSI